MTTWRQRHRAKARLLARKQRAAWRKRNPGVQVTLNAKWARANPVEYLVRLAKYRAKRKGLEFAICVDDLMPAPEFCPVFPTIRLRYGIGPRSAASASIDRKDSRKGYIKGNVTIMSRRANLLKNNASTAELEAVLAFMKR